MSGLVNHSLPLSYSCPPCLFILQQSLCISFAAVSISFKESISLVPVLVSLAVVPICFHCRCPHLILLQVSLSIFFVIPLIYFPHSSLSLFLLQQSLCVFLVTALIYFPCNCFCFSCSSPYLFFCSSPRCFLLLQSLPIFLAVLPTYFPCSSPLK